jgi:hypothetical protein
VNAQIYNEAEFLKPEEIPLCRCGDICDRQTLAGRWYHAACEDCAKEQMERTKRILEAAEKARGRKR